MSNAFKYTPENGAVTLSVIYSEGNENTIGNFVHIIVENDGITISKKDREHIFNRFYRTSTAKNELTTGTGIGLALVKELVELHGGEITVEIGKNNLGNLFNVSLPAREYNNHQQENRNKEVDVNEQLNTNIKINGVTNKRNVLVVEDNDDMRSFIVAQLDDLYNVHEANSGKEALNLLDSYTIDVVISDVMMPHMNGVELLKKIKNTYQSLPVILLTAKADAETRILALKSHADDFLAKPFNSEELTLKVANLVGEGSSALSSNHRVADLLIEDNNGQALIVDFQALLNKNDFLTKAQECVLNHLQDHDFDVKALADQLFMSRSTLQRKIENQTQFTAAQFIRHIRLQKAHQYIQQKVHRTLAETAYAVGFKHPGYFSKLYRNYVQQIEQDK